MNNAEIIAGAATLIISIIGLFLAFRSEQRRQYEDMMKLRIEDERRHTNHEMRLDSLEEISLLHSEILSGILQEENCHACSFCAKILMNRENIKRNYDVEK